MNADERAELRGQVWELLDEYELSFPYAGDEAIEFELTASGTIILEFEDGDEEFELDALDDRLIEVADELGESRVPPDPLDAFASFLQRTLDDHVDDDVEDLEHDVCCYDALAEAAADLGPKKFGLTEDSWGRYSDSDGVLWRLELDGFEVYFERESSDEEE